LENSRRGRLFDPEKPSKSEALSDWTKFPHIDIFEASTFLDGLLPSEYFWKVLIPRPRGPGLGCTACGEHWMTVISCYLSDTTLTQMVFTVFEGTDLTSIHLESMWGLFRVSGMPTPFGRQ
jgi:hypothetical protein